MPKKKKVKKCKDIVPIDGEFVNISLKGLNYRYIPMAYPEKYWNGSMALETSPHVKILKLYIRWGWDWNIFKATPYVKERFARGFIMRDPWGEHRIIKHLRLFFSLYESMKKRGYKRHLAVSHNGKLKPVMVLKKPIWESRFNYDVPMNETKLEIHGGGHRCACACVLGWKEIEGIWYEDKKPGTMELKSITEKFRCQMIPSL